MTNLFKKLFSRRDKKFKFDVKNYPNFSIIVNTLNRADHLKKVLNSFQWLKYPGEFEVIVVNGPSTDHSRKIIRSWLPHIRVAQCDKANLSVSRNIGIAMAQGEIIAFIDDDAIPEPEWLMQLAEAYTDPKIGGVGGFVYDDTGYYLQYQYCVVDRFANAYFSPTHPVSPAHLQKHEYFSHLLGCNASFRRSALHEIKGFDEAYEYFLDETDVCLRLIDAGYQIVQLPHAFVHHYYASNQIRNKNKMICKRFSIIKNKIYFILKHAQKYYPYDRIFHEIGNFIQHQSNEMHLFLQEQKISSDEILFFQKEVQDAIQIGFKQGFENRSTLLNEKNIKKYYAKNFLPFKKIKNKSNQVIIFISQALSEQLKNHAQNFAMDGNIIHVITKQHDMNQVIFENGIWLHHIVGEEWHLVVVEEIVRIASHREIDHIKVFEEEDKKILSSLKDSFSSKLNVSKILTSSLSRC